MKLLILGAGGHGRVCGEIAVAAGYEILFLDDSASGAVGKFKEYAEFRKEYDAAFVALGNPQSREEWFEKMKASGYVMVSLVSEKALISPSSVIDEGSVVMAGTIIQANAKIGKGCIISAGAIIDHDSTLGAFTHVNCNAVVPSMSEVGEKIKINYGEVWRNV